MRLGTCGQKVGQAIPQDLLFSALSFYGCNKRDLDPCGWNSYHRLLQTENGDERIPN